MCGIAGFLGLPLPADAQESVLGRMLATIVHRGPDDEGSWIEPARGIAIGMRRLSIVDLAGGHQPIWNEDRTVGVVFNGEIYNHAALRGTLEREGHHFQTRSDTEVLVHLYETHGPAMLAQLQGMYAFAIVDFRHGTLFLARDPFGQKPLYAFTPRAGAFAFASEAKALRNVPGWRGEIDAEAYFDYVTWLSLPAPGTHWRGVEKFGPGEWRVLRLDTAELSHRGRVPGLDFRPMPDLSTSAEAAGPLEAALRDSVRRHLEADVPVGLLLSGGSDSLAIGWTVAQVTRSRLHTFTAGFAGEDNEFEPARRTADILRSEHHEIMLAPDLLTEHVDRLLHHLDEPIGDPAAVAVLAVCRAAQPHVKVLLGGEGSDELFAGYGGRYAGLATQWENQRRIRRLLGWLPGRPKSYASSRLRRTLERARTSAGENLLAARAEGLGPHHPWVRRHAPQLLPRWRQRIARIAAALPLADASPGLDAAQVLDTEWQLPESLLVKADRMSMAASVELRCPFLDPVVAAVAGRVAGPARLDRATQLGKRPLRALLQARVPGEVNRPKAGFPLPLGRWLRGPLAGDVRARLEDENSAFATLVGVPAARAWCEAFMGGQGSPHLTYALWLYERWREKQQ